MTCEDLDAACGTVENGCDGAVLVRVTAPTWGGSCGSYRLDVAVR